MKKRLAEAEADRECLKRIAEENAPVASACTCGDVRTAHVRNVFLQFASDQHGLREFGAYSSAAFGSRKSGFA